MAELLLHPNTKEQVTAFLARPSQSLMITGQLGSGKSTLARYLAANLVGTEIEKLDNYPYFMVLSRPDDKQEIPIESVRGVIHELKLKPAILKHGKAQKLVLVNDAQLLSEEAQNALLKIVEEPPPGTVFILTVPSDSDVLPTIASRVQKITIAPVGLEPSQKYFADRASDEAIASAWSLSQGAVGLLSAILAGDQEHPIKQAVDSAKSFLKASRYERIISLENLSRDKEELAVFLDALNRVLSALQQAVVENGNSKLSARLTSSRRLAGQAAIELSKNASPRLVGLNLAVNLSI